MTILQNLYISYSDKKLTKNQFLMEINKYPQYRQHYSNANSFDDILKILKRKQLIVENSIIPSQNYSAIEPLNFNTINNKEIHIIKCNVPSEIQFMYNDMIREVPKENIEDFILQTYDGNTDDKEDLEIVSDFLMHKKDELDSFDSVGEKSLDELDLIKKTSQKVLKINDEMLHEVLTMDTVVPYQYNLGFNIENEKCKDAIKASKIVLKNLEANPSYYMDLISKHNTKKDLRPQKVTDDTLIDKLNPMVKVKVPNKDSLKSLLKEELKKYLKIS